MAWCISECRSIKDFRFHSACC